VGNNSNWAHTVLSSLLSQLLFCASRNWTRRFAAFALLVILAFSGWSSARGQEKLQVLRNHVRHEVADGRARLVGVMPGDERLSFSIVLPLRNEAELDQLLGLLYEPSSPDYRQFLGVADFTERFGPTAEAYAAVVAFAEANGLEVTEAPANRLIVPVSGTVAAINHAFHVRMSLYQHPTENRIFFSPDREPSLALSVPVAHLAGLNNYSLPKPLVERAAERGAVADVAGSGPGGSYLASDMRAAYYGATQLTGDGQAVGLLEFGGYYLSDVNLTFSNAGQSYSVPINNVLLDGANPEPIDEQSDAEQVLDIVQAIGMAPGLSQVRVYIGNSDEISADDASVLNAMASENLAKTLSCSWSWIPDDPATDDVFFKEFAVQGQSFFAASGDAGAFDAAIDPYFYPAEDAYVTAVGGTHLTTQSAGGPWEAETAWNNPPDGSGGGVSPDGIPIPSWQSGLATSANRGSTTLRNIPDVAMESDFDNFSCAVGECDGGYAGTSFAAPRWAAFTALVNQQAVEAGTAPMGGVGFLNPSIYSIGKGSNYADDFHDIVSGTNLTNSQPIWYSTEAGYDLVTGWGSPTGQDLINDLAGTQTPGFWISASSPSVVMNPGASGSTTISLVDAGGFTGKVQLAITSKLPSGVTAQWGTNPASGSSVLTLTAASTVANITTPVTITGTSGSIIEKTQITLTVHTPSFSISTLPDSVAMGPNTSVVVAVHVTPLYGFTGSVNLAVSGLPKGVTATLGTNSATGESLLTIDASSSAAVGSSNVTITGTSGSVKVTTTLALTIHLPTFVLFNSGVVNLGPGTSGQTFIFIGGEYGFSSPVNLSVAGLPKGVTASFSSNPASIYSTLTLTADSSAPLGSSALMITGTSGNLKATTNCKLNILAPTFVLSSAGQVSIGRGTTASAWVYVNPEYGFSGSVNLTVSGLPSGVTASLTPNPSIGSTMLVLTASSSAELGTSTITITGTSGSLKATKSFTLGVYVPTFTLSDIEPKPLGQGSSTSASIFVNPEYGFAGSVSLAVSGLRSGVTASISPNPVTGTAVLTLNASESASIGTSTVTVTGVSGAQTAKTTFTLDVVSPAFTLTGPGTVNLGSGTSTPANVTVTPEYGFLGSVNLSLSGLPNGVTASFSPNPTTGTSVLTLTAGGTAKLANSTVKLIGTSGSKTVSTTFPLAIAAPGFALSNAGSIELGQGTSQTTYINLSPENGFTGSVHLAVSGLPTGVTASFDPNLITQSTILTLDASSAAKAGSWTVTVTGTSGTQKATTTIPLKVVTPTFTLQPAGTAVIAPGGVTSTTIFINPEYGFTGSVKLSASDLPTGVTASFSPNPTTGLATLTLTASGAAVPGNKTVTIKGICGSKTASAPLTLTISKGSFNLSAPPSVGLAPGATTTADIYVVGLPGFTGSVQFAISGLPSGVTAAFSPNPASGISVLTLTAESNAAQENTNVTITGTLGKQMATTTVQLQVHAPAFTFSSPSSVTIGQGGTATSYFYVLPEYGFTGFVNFSLSDLPAGVTASWAPNPATYSSTLTLTTSSAAPIESAAVTITGTSGSLSASTTLQLTVVPPSFTIGTSSVSMSRGTTAATYVYVYPLNDVSSNVHLAITGLPSGVTGSFSPSSTNSFSTLTLTASDSAHLGQYNAVVTGTYGKVTSSSLLNITVASSASGFTVSVNGVTQVGRGTSTTAPVSVSPQNGFSGSVLLSAKDLPGGVTATFSPNPTASGSTMTLTASDGASLGEYNSTIVGTSGKQTVSSPFSVSVYTPTFTLSTYQSAVLSPGSSGLAYISINPLYGFLGSVNLSVSGLPTGVAASFSPNPVTEESVMTLTASKSASPGQYNLTVTGVSGKESATTVVPLMIGTPTFTLFSEGAAVGQGQSATAYVSVNSNNGFSSAVELQATGLPGGVTVSFSPNPATYSSNLTLTATMSAPPGEYTFTIVGKGGGQTASTQGSVTIAPPSFSLWGPGAVQLGQGGSASTSVGFNTEYGFSGNIELSITGLPSGVQASFSPNPTSTGSTLTLTASSSAPPGTYNATIKGVSGTQSSSTSFSLQIAAPSFTLSGYNSLTLGQGTSTTANISVYPSFGFDGTVLFSVSGLPSGVAASFSPPSSSGGTTLTLTAANTVLAGLYTVTVSGVSGATKATMPISVTVGTPSFSISSYGVQLGQGSSAATTVYVNSAFGFAGSVQLRASDLPAGMTAYFSPNPTNYYISTLTIGASSSVEPGQYNITVTGTSGSRSQSTTIPLTVYPPKFAMSTWDSVSIGRGSSATMYVNLYNEYGSPIVHLAVSGLPQGVTATFSPNPTTNGSTLSLTASSTASLGEYTVTVTGTSGSESASTMVALTIYDPTFTISNSGNVNIGQGTSTTTNVSVYPEYGFAGSVHLAASDLPSGVTASFSPNPTTNGSTLTLTASSTASLGQYNVTVTGTSGSQSASTTLTLTVYVPTFTISSPYNVNIGQGTSETTTALVTPEYGFTGEVNLTASRLPPGVTASFSPNPTTNTSTLTLTASSTASVGAYNITITGTSGSQSASTTLALGVFVPGFTIADYGSGPLSAGESVNSYVNITDEYGFTGDIQLTVSGLPSGVTASFSPNPATTSSTLTLNAGSSVKAGQYTFTIAGASDSYKASTSVGLTIN
jgi:subtilase family serine protease